MMRISPWGYHLAVTPFCTGAGLPQLLLHLVGVALVLMKEGFSLSPGGSVVLTNREGMIAEGSLCKTQGTRLINSHKMNTLLPARGMGGYVKPMHGL